MMYRKKPVLIILYFIPNLSVALSLMDPFKGTLKGALTRTLISEQVRRILVVSKIPWDDATVEESNLRDRVWQISPEVK